MGNQHAKKDSKMPFSGEELKVLEASFRASGAHSEKLTREKFMESWSCVADPHLVQCTANFLFKLARSPVVAITLRQYCEPYYIVANGSLDDKLNLLSSSLEHTDPNNFTIKELEYYIASILRTYIKMEAEENSDVYKSWKNLGYQSAERTVLAFAKGLIRSVNLENDHFLNLNQLERWLQVNPTFLIMWHEVFSYMYSKNSGRSYKLGSVTHGHILPISEGLASCANYTPILDLPHVIFANSCLPNEFRHKWRFLFSSKIMGESFSTMLGKILNRGPTLIFVEDEDRYIFGGFAPDSWSLKANFCGNDSALLYTLCPAMRCFSSTGYNDHYQYLNLNQQTMPNGLGMGGQFGYWGLWIDSDYGMGQSCESCSTFRDYVQLSKRKEFRIRNIEVWAVGDEPKDDDSDDDCTEKKSSILDKNMEDKVMLQLAGKTLHSEGLREPEMDL